MTLFTARTRRLAGFTNNEQVEILYIFCHVVLFVGTCFHPLLLPSFPFIFVFFPKMCLVNSNNFSLEMYKRGLDRENWGDFACCAILPK